MKDWTSKRSRYLRKNKETQLSKELCVDKQQQAEMLGLEWAGIWFWGSEMAAEHCCHSWVKWRSWQQDVLQGQPKTEAVQFRWTSVHGHTCACTQPWGVFETRWKVWVMFTSPHSISHAASSKQAIAPVQCRQRQLSHSHSFDCYLNWMVQMPSVRKYMTVARCVGFAGFATAVPQVPYIQQV